MRVLLNSEHPANCVKGRISRQYVEPFLRGGTFAKVLRGTVR